MTNKLIVPDIGDFENVEVIEILVKPGDFIKKNDAIATIESDKSSVEVPSPYEGKILEINVKIGDKVSKGSLLGSIDNKELETPNKEKKKYKSRKKIWRI